MKKNGFTLLELMVVIGLISATSLVFYNWQQKAFDDTQSSVVSNYMKTVSQAGNHYIKDNYTALMNVATATKPALIRVSDLIAGGYLPTGFSSNNPMQQNTCILALQPTANNINAIVVTEGGKTIDDTSLGQMAAGIGGEGGAIYSSTNTNFTGSMGGWSLPFGAYNNANSLNQNCSGAAGKPTLAAGHPVVGMWFADGTQLSPGLYRDPVPGNPGLNTMNTPIIMGNSTIQTVGATCSTNGAIGRDATGILLNCVSGKWQKAGALYWQDPVNNVASLPACTASTVGQTRVVLNPTTASGASTSRAYTCAPNLSWSPLGLDDSGSLVANNMSVSGWLTGNYIYGSVMHAPTGSFDDLYSQNGIYTKGGIVADSIIQSSSTLSGANIYTAGTLTASNTNINNLGGNLTVTTHAVQGWACPTLPNGSIASDPNGIILSCQNGIWQRSQGTPMTLPPNSTASCVAVSNYNTCDHSGNVMAIATTDSNGNVSWVGSEFGGMPGTYTYSVSQPVCSGPWSQVSNVGLSPNGISLNYKRPGVNVTCSGGWH